MLFGGFKELQNLVSFGLCLNAMWVEGGMTLLRMFSWPAVISRSVNTHTANQTKLMILKYIVTIHFPHLTYTTCAHARSPHPQRTSLSSSAWSWKSHRRNFFNVFSMLLLR